MRHIKGISLIKKKPYIIAIIIVVLTAGLVTTGYIDVNHRFPEPEEEIYEKDEWLDYAEEIKIKAAQPDYCSDMELNEKYNANVKESGRYNYIVVKLSVSNQSQSIINFMDIIMKTNLVIYPCGYENQAECVENNLIVNPGQTQQFTLYFLAGNSSISKKKINKMLKQDIYLCFKAYPVRQAVKFRGIDG